MYLFRLRISFPLPLTIVQSRCDFDWTRLTLLLCAWLSISGTSNVCHLTADCPLNSYCEPRSGWDGQCVCSDGYFMKSSGKLRECIRIADYGELCYMNKQCEFRLGLEAECRNGQCSCKDGAHYVVNENACFNSSSEYNFKHIKCRYFVISCHFQNTNIYITHILFEISVFSFFFLFLTFTNQFRHPISRYFCIECIACVNSQYNSI